MKIFLSTVTIIILFTNCCKKDVDIKGCTDENALNKIDNANLDDGSCVFSSLTFYSTLLYVNGIPISQIDILVNGTKIGSIPGGFFYTTSPGNCSSPGTVKYTFKNGLKVDWNANIYLANGMIIYTSGQKFPLSNYDCIKVNVTN